MLSGCCCLLQIVHTGVRVLLLVACSHCCQGVVACCSMFTLLSGCCCLLQLIHTVVRVFVLVAACSHCCQSVVACCSMFTLCQCVVACCSMFTLLSGCCCLLQNVHTEPARPWRRETAPWRTAQLLGIWPRRLVHHGHRVGHRLCVCHCWGYVCSVLLSWVVSARYWFILNSLCARVVSVCTVLKDLGLVLALYWQGLGLFVSVVC